MKLKEDQTSEIKSLLTEKNTFVGEIMNLKEDINRLRT